ncbi:DUF5690 family protein [Lewinella sp. LCG006]|uniref:DUF5690 family protein n=1 Tax=Lewinella sp. LCG006 TaxID=3231911 RepID=UPI00345F94D1
MFRPVAKWSPLAITVFAMCTSFATYFCMYAFRRPFTVAAYETATAVGMVVDFKIAIIIAQVLGYATSKFIGIKFISELRPGVRFRMLLRLVGIAWLALLGFALSKDSGWSLLFLFLNGLPLGMVWGVVFSYLEGRQTTELLGAALCASFIVASGVVKSVGAWLIQYQSVSEYWMPFATGAIFLPGLVLGGWLMEKIPQPSNQDVALRTERAPMTKVERKAFSRKHGLGILALIVCYVSITIYRDFRDNFALELWTGLGYGDAPAIFTLAELPIAVLTLVMLALTMFIRNNRTAFLLYLWLILGGGLVVGGSTIAFQAGVLPGAWWMILIGAGLYIIYIPYNAILFERLIAALGSVANVGFLIYLADAWGYAGSVLTLLYRNFGQGELSWLIFFTKMSYLVALVSCATTIIAIVYFYHKIKQAPVLGAV